MPLLLALKALLIAAGAFASWSDVYRRRIPNWLCLATAALGLIFGFAAGGWALPGSQAAHAVIALIVGMALFKFGVMGGGDAKFYAAIAAWFGLSRATTLLMTVTLCGLLLLIVWFLVRRVQGKPIRRRSNDPYDGLPYGLAIAAGAVICLFVFA